MSQLDEWLAEQVTMAANRMKLYPHRNNADAAGRSYWKGQRDGFERVRIALAEGAEPGDMVLRSGERVSHDEWERRVASSILDRIIEEGGFITPSGNTWPGVGWVLRGTRLDLEEPGLTFLAVPLNATQAHYMTTRYGDAES